jgi:predicted ATPase
MLFEFSVTNFRSFKDKSTLSLRASSDDSLETESVFTVGSDRLLKSAALYGANASGKSNFLAAMRFFREFALDSFAKTQVGETIRIERHKLNSEAEHKPAEFEAVFQTGDARFRFGFRVSETEVQQEWLYRRKPGSSKETRLYLREGKSINVAASFAEGRGLETRTRANALFLSVCAQFNGPQAEQIIGWFRQFRFVSGLDDMFYMAFTAQRLKDSHMRKQILKFAQRADLALENLEVRDVSAEQLAESLPDTFPKEVRQFLVSHSGGFSIRSFHTKFNAAREPVGLVEFDLADNESAGTQKIVSLSGPLLATLSSGSILVIDELEARLHPLLVRAVVSLFNSSANSKNAQLVFATHSEGLLNPKYLRRDQVWFVSKDRFGASQLYPLKRFSVRKEANFEREYMLGSFGGVPRLSLDESLSSWNNNGNEKD